MKRRKRNPILMNTAVKKKERERKKRMKKTVQYK